MPAPNALPPLIARRDWTKAPTKEARLPSADLFSTSRKLVEPTRDALAEAYRHAPRELREAVVDAYQPDAEDVLVSWTLSTSDIDRPGDTIRQEGWHTENFAKNPVVLFAHNSSAFPVGRDLGTYLFNGALKGLTRFTPEGTYDFGAACGRMVKGGFLNAVSVGFRPLEWEIAEDRDEGDSWFAPVDFIEQELLEYSVVPIPANPHALIDGKAFKAAGIGASEARHVVEWLERQLEGGAPLVMQRDVLQQILPPWRQLSARRQAANNKEDPVAKNKTPKRRRKGSAAEMPENGPAGEQERDEEEQREDEDEEQREAPEEEQREGHEEEEREANDEEEREQGEEEERQDGEEEEREGDKCPACGHVTKPTEEDKESDGSDDSDSTTNGSDDPDKDGADDDVVELSDEFDSPEDAAKFIGQTIRDVVAEVKTELTGRLPG